MFEEQMAHPELTARQVYRWVKDGVASANFQLPEVLPKAMPEASPELSAVDEDQQLRILMRQDRENNHEHELETLRIQREQEEAAFVERKNEMRRELKMPPYDLRGGREAVVPDMEHEREASVEDIRRERGAMERNIKRDRKAMVQDIERERKAMMEKLDAERQDQWKAMQETVQQEKDRLMDDLPSQIAAAKAELAEVRDQHGKSQGVIERKMVEAALAAFEERLARGATLIVLEGYAIPDLKGILKPQVAREQWVQRLAHLRFREEERDAAEEKELQRIKYSP